MIFITSDTHFGHDRGFIYESRGFNSIKEHDEAIIERWNEVIFPEDTVYHLGDMMLNNNEHGLECVRRLDGHIKLILGNHDTDARIRLYQELPNVEILGYSTIIKYNKCRFYLSHFPTFSSNLEKSTSLREHLCNLHGHTHSKSKFYQDIPFMMNCGVDAHNCYPISMEDVIKSIKDKAQECLDML